MINFFLFMLTRLLLIGIFSNLFFTSLSQAAVILQYHHVSEDTPASTSISPSQFQAHLQFLKDNNFNVVPLSDIIKHIKTQTPIAPKTIAITFDDGYLNNFTHAKPILDNFNYPYTIFINPQLIDQNSRDHMSWPQIKQLSNQGVIFANHGYNHDSLIRKPDNQGLKEWMEKQAENLLKAEERIKSETGQNWRYFAYPYGEYGPKAQAWMKANGYVAFSQQSGAVGITSELTSLSRFPASKPYDDLATLKDKLNSLAFDMPHDELTPETTFAYGELKQVTIDINVDDFKPDQLNCYVTNLGRQHLIWQNNSRFSMKFEKPLLPGRSRSNCTAPSLSQPGKFYWFSKPFFIMEKDGSWYPL